MTPPPDQDRDLRLHRKYIYVLSLILLLIKYGDVTIVNNEYSILGTKLHFENPQVILITLWTLLVYSTIRYWQYFKTFGYQQCKNAYNTLRNRIFKSKLHSIILFEGESRTDISEFMKNKENLEWQDQEEWNYGSTKKVNKKMSNKTFNRELNLPVLAKLKGLVKLEGTTANVYFHDRQDFWKQYVKLIPSFLINHSQFWEYYFPLILFGFTTISCGLLTLVFYFCGT